MNEDVDLDRLLAGEMPETSWSIDDLGNLRSIHLETGESEVVAHMCELPEESRDVIVRELMSIIEKVKFECSYIEGRHRGR